ncbi:MAG TPA: hypothetical protein VIJ41_03970, partial [Candidatus Nanopelagicales bacterium]
MEYTPYAGTTAAPPAPGGYPAVAYPDSFTPEPVAEAVEAPLAPEQIQGEPAPESATATPAAAPPPANAPWLPADLSPAPAAGGRTVHDTALNPHSAATFATESAAHNGRQTTEQTLREEDFSLVDALTQMLDRGASDLHLTSAAKPTIRVTGELVALDDFEVLTPPVLQRVIYAILTQAQRLKFEEQLELDFAYSLPGRARFRVNVYRQRDAVGAAFRVIPFEIKTLESLGIPPSVSNFANLPRGFVL